MCSETALGCVNDARLLGVSDDTLRECSLDCRDWPL